MPTSWLQPCTASPISPSSVQEICAHYFETHVSPMLEIIQKSQELLDAKLEANCARVQKTIDVLTVKVHGSADVSEVARLAELLESKPELSSRRIMGPKISRVPPAKALSQNQRQDRADSFEESLLQESLLQECMARLAEVDAALAKKADTEHVATLVQLQEMRAELLAATAVTAVTAEHKDSRSSKILKSKIANVEENNERLQEEKERLQVQLDAAMQQLQSTSAARTVDIEAHVPAVADAVRRPPPSLPPPTSQEPDEMELSLTQVGGAMDKWHSEMEEHARAEFLPGTQGSYEVTDALDELHSTANFAHLEEPPLLDKDLEDMEDLGDKEITFLSDDSTPSCLEDLSDSPTPQQSSVLSKDPTPEAEQARGGEVCIVAQTGGDRLQDKLEEVSCDAWLVDTTQIYMEAETLRNAILRTAHAGKDEALQQVETNVEEENERLPQKFQTSIAMSFTEESI